MSKRSKDIIALTVIIITIIIIIGALFINQNIKSSQVSNNIGSGTVDSSSKIVENNEIINETENKEIDLVDENEIENDTNNNTNIKTDINIDTNAGNNTKTKTNTNTDTDTGTIIYPKKLILSELKELENYLNQKENNGFVSPYNIYSKPSEIKLRTIFYDAFGLEGGNSSLSEDELNVYKASGGFANTDIRKVTTEQAKERYLEKTGENLTNLSSRLNWIYLEQYDAYYTEGGDTGMFNVKCLSGIKNQDGTYVIEIIAGNTREIVTLKKNGDNYLFVSNVKK